MIQECNKWTSVSQLSLVSFRKTLNFVCEKIELESSEFIAPYLYYTQSLYMRSEGG